jgi:hypothetical protein
VAHEVPIVRGTGEYCRNPRRLNKVERRDGLLVTCTEEFGSGAI